MIQTLEELLNAHREPIYLLFRRLKAMDRQFLLWSDLVHDYEQFCQSEVGAPLLESGMTPIMRHAQEAVVDEPFINLAVRMRVGRWKYVQVHTEEMRCRELTVAEFLDIKERVAAGIPPGDRYVLEVDLSPFERGFPKLKDSRNIGRGVEFLNRHLSGRLFMDGGRGEKLLFDFLQVHEVRGQQLMLNGTLRDVEELREALAQATTLLEAHTEESDALDRELRRLGFESGWGRALSGADANDLLDRDPFAPWLFRAVQRPRQTGYRRADRLYPRSGSRLGARDARVDPRARPRHRAPNRRRN
jgi:sucrose synthase